MFYKDKSRLKWENQGLHISEPKGHRHNWASWRMRSVRETVLNHSLLQTWGLIKPSVIVTQTRKYPVKMSHSYGGHEFKKKWILGVGWVHNNKRRILNRKQKKRERFFCISDAKSWKDMKCGDFSTTEEVTPAQRSRWNKWVPVLETEKTLKYRTLALTRIRV